MTPDQRKLLGHVADGHVALCQDIEEEAAEEVPEHKPPTTWPEEGAISFKEVCFCYRPDLPLVLDNVNLDIKGGEKVAITNYCRWRKTYRYRHDTYMISCFSSVPLRLALLVAPAPEKRP